MRIRIIPFLTGAACALAVLGWATPVAADPYFVLDSEEQWNDAMSAGQVEPMLEFDWFDYMNQWLVYTEEGDPYPPNQFLPAYAPTGELYVYGGGGSGGADPEDAGLVMYWGPEPIDPGSYSSAWEYHYGLDPDLTNCTISVTVTAPPTINVVSFGIQDINGNIRGWYWNVGGAGDPIQHLVPTNIVINTSLTGIAATTPQADSYMNNPAFDLTQSLDFIFDENSVWVGTTGIPTPGTGMIGSWNYWHNIIVLPFQNIIKWAQPPAFNEESPFPDCYWGWDELSHYEYGPIVADDFLCKDDRPITDIHWWGSYWNWDYEGPPPDAPPWFHIGIWTDVPDSGEPGDFSHPGTMIHEWWVQRDQLLERRVGCDFHPVMGYGLPETCFRYDFVIPESEWFWQGPDDTIYWISIAADYAGATTTFPWGWKTREHFYNDDAVRIFDPVTPSPVPPQDAYVDGEPIWWPTEEDSWDMAFVLTTDRDPPEVYKWDQPPEPYDPPNVYNGWDEYSEWIDPTWPGYPGVIAADDWQCMTDDPITKVRWWGSFIGWRETYPPPIVPAHFHIDFWTDVPAGVNEDFSHPGTVVWDIIGINPYSTTWVGWDRNPATGEYESCFEFVVDLDPAEWFYQEPGTNSIYWISIAACYGGVTPVPEYPFGWKTRPNMFNDDAVRIFDPSAPWWGSMWVNGEPIFYPTEDDSWDLAFELIAEGQGGTITKWEQMPDLTTEGIDVNATNAEPVGPTFILADDFECTTTGPVTDIHIWGSWYHDETPYNELPPSSVVFTLSIHEDIPAGTGGLPYSRPGNVLWMRTFYPGEFGVFDYAQGILEGWLNPPDQYEFPADTVCWQYDFLIDAAEAFYQEGTPENPVIYWLDVQVPFQMGGDVYFGWKTSVDHWNDDAVWGDGVEPYTGPWYELRYPPQHPYAGQSIDLAFRITGEGSGGQYVKWSQPPELYTPDDGYYGWNEQSVYGSNQIAADDWLCQTDFPVTDVHWWGSFIGWGYTEPPQLPDRFHIGIWTDQMCAGAPSDFSCPDELIWENWCDTYTWEFVGWDWDPRFPDQPPEACFKFEQDLNLDDWFLQEDGDNIYWLSIAAQYDTAITDYLWGWKTRPNVFADDAVRIFVPTMPDLLLNPQYIFGEPIWWPTETESWDLAFQLTTIECTTIPGDLNGDWKINGDDIQCFVDCLINGFAAQSAVCDCACADMDGDGYLTTAGDVPAFVAALL